MERPAHVSPVLRYATWAIAAGCALALITVLHSIKAKQQEIFVPLKPSIESSRRPIERAIDTGATAIDLSPRQTTLEGLRSMPRPPELDEGNRNHRYGPFETHVWTFRGKVVEAYFRDDGDLYLVVEANGIRGCVEEPDPKYCENSPFAKNVAETRRQLLSRIKPARGRKVSFDAELTGIGFFGTSDGHDNGARLMPIIAVRWLGPG